MNVLHIVYRLTFDEAFHPPSIKKTIAENDIGGLWKQGAQRISTLTPISVPVIPTDFILLNFQRGKFLRNRGRVIDDGES